MMLLERLVWPLVDKAQVTRSSAGVGTEPLRCSTCFTVHSLGCMASSFTGGPGSTKPGALEEVNHVFGVFGKFRMNILFTRLNIFGRFQMNILSTRLNVFVEHSVEFRLARRHIIIPGLYTVFLPEHRPRIRGDLNLLVDRS